MIAARVSSARFPPTISPGEKSLRVGLFLLSVLAGCSVDLGKLRAPHEKDAASLEAAGKPDTTAVAGDSASIESLAPDGPQAFDAAGWDVLVLGPEIGPSLTPDGAFDPPTQDEDSSAADGPLNVSLEDGGQDGPAGIGDKDAPDESDGTSDAESQGAADVRADGATSRSDGGDDDAGGDADARGATWIKIAGSSPQHFRPAVGYDSTLQRAALFGGHTSCFENQATNQTWEWDGTGWSKMTPTGQIPSARGAIGMAFDRAHGEVIIHGGWVQPNSIQSGTYAYNLGTHAWASRGSPPNLAWYAIDYDTDADLVRIFGGSDNRTFSREVRSWISTGWQNTPAPSSGPTARSRHGWAFDQERHVFVMFGGVSNWFGGHLAETWEYDPAATTWQQTATSGVRPQDCDAPPPMVYDPGRKLVVMYCSLNGGETWEYDAGTHAWSQAVEASPIGAISGASVFYDTKLQSVLLVGGCKSGSLQDGTWQFIPAL